MLKDYDYEFEHDDYYCYPDSRVLKNKLGISDAETFEQAERDFTYLRSVEASKRRIRGNFDYAHLKRIHKFLFGDIYEWAGKPRQVNITKGNQFCRVECIQEQMEMLFGKLQQEHCLKDLKTKEEIAARLAYYLGEINAIHPFREGNGRTQRMFIEHLAHSLGYRLDFSKVKQQEMVLASAKAFAMDYSAMEELLVRILEAEKAAAR